MHRHSRNYRCRLRGKCDGMEPLDPELTNKNMRNTVLHVQFQEAFQTWCWVQTLRWTIAVMLCTRRFNQRNFYMVRLIWDWEVIEFLAKKTRRFHSAEVFGSTTSAIHETFAPDMAAARNSLRMCRLFSLSIDLEEAAKMGWRAAAAALERETIFHVSGTLWWTNIAMENHHCLWENPL